MFATRGAPTRPAFRYFSKPRTACFSCSQRLKAPVDAPKQTTHPLQNYRSAHISRSLGTSAALVVALDLAGVTIRRRSEIPHAKRTTPGDGAALVVPAVGVGPGRVMADTEAGRQVREDTPGGPYNLTTVQQHHRATRVVRTALLIGSLRGLAR